MNYKNKALLLILLTMLPLALLALLNLGFYISTTQTFKTPNFDGLILFINLFLCIIFIVSILVVRNILISLEEETRHQEQVYTIKYLEDIINAMRTQRHSFNHELQVVYGLIAVEAYAEAKEYLEKTRIQASLTNQIININNPSLRALLMVKSSQMESQNIQFNINITATLEKLPIPIHELNIILANLLDNAMEAILAKTPLQPEISLEITQITNKHHIVVSNNGIAIEQEVIAKLFLRDFSTKGEGRGIGLSIVKDMIEKGNGTINVSSNLERTVFTISFPE